LRFGVGKDFPKGGQIDYVLGRFPDEEMKIMPERLDIAAEAVKTFCLSGASFAMTQFNNK
jgi:PTH1 family peptidyl-tRNA hydrolase